MAAIPKISDAEWHVMDVLWSARDPLTANDVVDALSRSGWSAPTIKTMLNRLVRKKALRYRVEGKRYLYSPAVARDLCVRTETRGLVDRLFGGAIGPTLVHFVEDAKLSKDEIEQLRRMLDRKGR
jgi:BlaI family penicillinase repressor